MLNVEELTPPYPAVERDCCKGCGRCVVACPRHCLEMGTELNSQGVKSVAYVGTGCVGCGICFYNCPEPYALKVVKK